MIPVMYMFAMSWLNYLGGIVSNSQYATHPQWSQYRLTMQTEISYTKTEFSESGTLFLNTMIRGLKVVNTITSVILTVNLNLKKIPMVVIWINAIIS